LWVPHALCVRDREENPAAAGAKEEVAISPLNEKIVVAGS